MSEMDDIYKKKIDEIVSKLDTMIENNPEIKEFLEKSKELRQRYKQGEIGFEEVQEKIKMLTDEYFPKFSEEEKSVIIISMFSGAFNTMQ